MTTLDPAQDGSGDNGEAYPAAHNQVANAPPWADALLDYYVFRSRLCEAWKGRLEDVRHPIPAAVSQLLDVSSPREPLLEPADLRLPLFILNVARRIENKPVLQVDKGIGHFRQQKFTSPLLEDLENGSELARTSRIVQVFSTETPERLRFHLRMLEIELAAFDTGMFSDSNWKRLLPATILFAAGAATAWSALAGHFLGLDVLKAAWGEASVLTARVLGFWSKLFAWCIFGIGLLGILGLAVGRHQALNEKHQMQRVRRCLQLFLASGTNGPT